jgi:hypothetical protein
MSTQCFPYISKSVWQRFSPRGEGEAAPPLCLESNASEEAFHLNVICIDWSVFIIAIIVSSYFAHKKGMPRKASLFTARIAGNRLLRVRPSAARLSSPISTLDPWLCVPGFLPVCLSRSLRSRYRKHRQRLPSF